MSAECGCIDTANAALAKYGTEVSWGTTMPFGHVRVLVATQKRADAKRGTRIKSLIATFCPMCGKAYPR